MRCAKAYESRDGGTVEKYVIAAIVSAREGYHGPEWLFWADNWINGRDRSYESARLAHRGARKACADGSANLAEEGQTGGDSEIIESFCDERPAERAAWAAGLALVTAPMGPDLTGVFLRFEAGVKHRLAHLLAALPESFPLAVRWIGLARRLGALLVPSEVRAAGTAQS
jgi:hypothetical protein